MEMQVHPRYDLRPGILLLLETSSVYTVTGSLNFRRYYNNNNNYYYYYYYYTVHADSFIIQKFCMFWPPLLEILVRCL